MKNMSGNLLMSIQNEESLRLKFMIIWIPRTLSNTCSDVFYLSNNRISNEWFYVLVDFWKHFIYPTISVKLRFVVMIFIDF